MNSAQTGADGLGQLGLSGSLLAKADVEAAAEAEERRKDDQQKAGEDLELDQKLRDEKEHHDEHFDPDHGVLGEHHDAVDEKSEGNSSSNGLNAAVEGILGHGEGANHVLGPGLDHPPDLGGGLFDGRVGLSIIDPFTHESTGIARILVQAVRYGIFQRNVIEVLRDRVAHILILQVASQMADLGDEAEESDAHGRDEERQDLLAGVLEGVDVERDHDAHGGALEQVEADGELEAALDGLQRVGEADVHLAARNSDVHALILLITVCYHLQSQVMGRKDKKKQPKEEDEPREEEPTKQEEEEHEEEAVVEKQPLKSKKVSYCPICTLPFELCKFGKKAGDCRKFLMEVAPAKVEKYHPGFEKGEGAEEKVEEEEKAPKEAKKQKSLKDKYVVIDVKERTRKKFVTTISGLDIFKIDSKDLTKKLSKKFACSCSVQDSGTAVVQGDFSEDVHSILVGEYKIKKKYILDGEEFKAKQAEEKEKKKKERAKMGDIPEEPEPEEKKEPEVPREKTNIQKMLDDLGSDDDDQ